jgi:hypothetical protein
MARITMDAASDVMVVAGCLLLAAALWAIWWPLGLAAIGAELIALGFVFAVKAARARLKEAQDKEGQGRQ